MKNILVIGSINMDLVIHTPRLPKLGETLKGHSFMTACGGKGANQAIAVGKIYGSCTMIGAVGHDAFGKTMTDNLEANNVSTSGVSKIGENSGIAMITVCEGDNHILLDGGANDRLTPEWIDKHIELIQNADIVIFQLEVPMETVVYAAKKAKEFGAKVLLNPAPAAPLSDELLGLTDILIPNEHEAEIITGIHEPEEAIKVLMQKCNQVIITLGEKGCIYNDGTEIKTSPAEKAKAVDTTAAGDSFIGAFCTALCEGKSLKDSIAFGAKVSAITVTRKGAAISIPTKEELLSF